jgi:hypothetical protein
VLKEALLRSNLDSEIYRYHESEAEPFVNEPSIIHHPIDPTLQTGESILLGGALSIHAPWSADNDGTPSS